MLTLTSPAFGHEGSIPERHTCEGADRSPPLEWTGAPANTRSFVLIVDDPDAPDPAAPKRVWVHWIRYNMGSASTGLAEGAGSEPPVVALEALTDAGTTGYHGPCPPIGNHRYYFRLCAMDTVLPDLGPRATRADVERAMQGHVIAEAVLMGTYFKRKGS
ncbi:MAG: YbhB/YbcL family Raf kinase inhibitor-like protein [Cytophagaceae bacterium]|nr:YbhB/YbcL family Raf kinase inhibitor-like protein [Gemmatimonadaceae bacterium]